jgi:hypothetical protein
MILPGLLAPSPATVVMPINASSDASSYAGYGSGSGSSAGHHRIECLNICGLTYSRTSDDDGRIM